MFNKEWFKERKEEQEDETRIREQIINREKEFFSHYPKEEGKKKEGKTP